MIRHLSKSSYMSGLQCEKRLYIELKRPDLRQPLSDSEQTLLWRGIEVGAGARSRYPGGVHVAEVGGARPRCHAPGNG